MLFTFLITFMAVLAVKGSSHTKLMQAATIVAEPIRLTSDMYKNGCLLIDLQALNIQKLILTAKV